MKPRSAGEFKRYALALCGIEPRSLCARCRAFCFQQRGVAPNKTTLAGIRAGALAAGEVSAKSAFRRVRSAHLLHSG